MVDAISTTQPGQHNAPGNEVRSLDERMRQAPALHDGKRAEPAVKMRRKQRPKATGVHAVAIQLLPVARQFVVADPGDGAINGKPEKKPVIRDKKASLSGLSTGPDTAGTHTKASPAASREGAVQGGGKHHSEPEAASVKAKEVPVIARGAMHEKKRDDTALSLPGQGLSAPLSGVESPRQTALPVPRPQWAAPQVAGSEATTETQGISYQFKSWGAEHSVLLQRSAGTEGSTFVLHPSSARVEQQLLDHPMTPHNAQVTRDSHGQQQQQSQDQNDPTADEED
jgi:hypothetical protein